MSNSFERLFSNMGGGEVMIFVVIMLLFALAALLAVVFFLITLQKTFNAVSPDLRKMNPGGLVWLMLIPYFGNIWIFFIVTRMADSLRGEFDRRQMVTAEERPGFNVGIAYASLNALGTIVGFMDIPSLSGFIGLAGLVLWITYWVKINRYYKELEQTGHWQQRMQAYYANTYNQQYWQQTNGGFNTANPQNPFQPQNNPYPPQYNPYPQQNNNPYPPQNPNPYGPPPVAPPNYNPPSSNPNDSPWAPKNDPPPNGN